MTIENMNPLIAAQTQVKKACDKLGIKNEVYEMLKNPMRILEVSIPVKMDDGTIKTFQGFRSQHNNAIGPTKGGIRFHPEVTRDEVAALSIWMTFKCSVTGIPYGGGKGGIIVDPKTLSTGELERLSRGYVRAIYPILGEKNDIPAPDVNTNGQIMAWMIDEYIKLSGNTSFGTFTGKPIELGGSLGRTKATGLGVSITLKEALKTQGKNIQNAKIAVQGFGNVGSWTAKCSSDFGATIVAIAEWNGVLFNENGIDIDALMKYQAENKTVIGFPGAKTISLSEFWELDVDAILPCALENSITAEIAENLKTKLIVEGANGPLTVDADKICDSRGIMVIPDILANAGGVTVSYFEWVQNNYGHYWSESEVEAKETDAMESAFNAIYAVATEYGVSMKEAAYLHSIKKITAAMELRGWC